MSGLVFLIAGLVALFGLGVPLLTLASKATLMLKRRRMADITELGSTATYLLIVGPVLVPLLWVVSAGLHQTESSWFAAGAGARHLAGQACWNALVLGVVAALALAGALLRARASIAAAHRRGRRERVWGRLERRIRRVCAGHPELVGLQQRVRVVERGEELACTTGLVRPTIELGCRLVRELDDEALQGALLHEAEHVRGLDPLRYLLATVAISLNPLGWLLADEFRYWRLAREARCDRAAVSRGASPLSLAQALLAAARESSRAASALPALVHRGDGHFLRLRIWLLLGYASARVTLPRPLVPAMLTVAAIAVVTAWLPHTVGAWPLDGLHVLVDGALARLSPG